MKKPIIAFTIVILMLNVYFLMVFNSKPQVIDVLIVYEEKSEDHLDTYQHFKQTLVANTNVETMSVNVIDSVDLTNYEMIYLDPSIIETTSFNNAKSYIQDFVKQGGHLFLENSFKDHFPKSFIGAEKFVPIENLKSPLEYPSVNRNIKGVQEVIKHFNEDLMLDPEHKKITVGSGMIPSTAEPLVSTRDGISLYTLNDYGSGTIFFASSLLPNDQFISRFDLKKKNKEQNGLDYTVLTGNFLFKNEYLSYVAKEMYGYSVTKVIGTHGRPGFAMEYILENTNDLKDGKIQTFMELVDKENLVPTLSLSDKVYEPNTWKESVVYYSNFQNQTEPAFKVNASQFTSGNPVKENQENLRLQTYPDQASFYEHLELPYRAYIDSADMNGDDHPDLIAGSADGKIYYYEGKNFDSEWEVHSGKPLLFETEQEIDLGSYSTPTYYDYNEDGLLDIVSGSEEGEIVVLIQTPDGTFEAPQPIIRFEEDDRNHTYTTPAIADYNGDGIDDLIFGTESGNLYYRLGEYEDETSDQTLTFSDNEAQLASTSGTIDVEGFSAPKIADYNQDGYVDLLIGSKNGFIRRYEMTQSKQFVDRGYINGDTKNIFGDERLWGGKNSVPVLADVNGDGNQDLIVGLLQYGDQQSITSSNFPYRKELKQLIESNKRYEMNIKPHLFLSEHKDMGEYKNELNEMKKAYETYGIAWDISGLTYHQDPANPSDGQQSVPSLEGTWWNTGIHSDMVSAKDHLSLPFVKMNNKVLTPAVYHQPNSGEDTPIQSYAQFDLPFAQRIENIETDSWISRISYFRELRDYNSMTEEQLYKSVLAAQQSMSTLNYNPIEKVFSDFQNLIRRKLHHTVYIEHQQNNEIPNERIEPYYEALGYKVELGEKYKGFVFNTDAPIYMHKGSTLYFSGKERIKLNLSTNYLDKPHVMKSNVPIKVEQTNQSVSVELLDSGMQQIKVYAPNGINISDQEWNVEHDKGTYILTKHGEPTTLNFSYKK